MLLLLTTALAAEPAAGLTPKALGWTRAASSGHRCGIDTIRQTPDSVACGWIAPPGRPALLPGRRDGEEKLVRDAYTRRFDEAHSDNFVIKYSFWFNADVQHLLDALEASWQRFVVEDGFVPPLGTETYKFNVYVGDVDVGLPSSEDIVGYFWYDEEGYPAIMLNPVLVEDVSRGETTVVHEFFHALQATNTLFIDEDASEWFSDAAATWAEHELFPTHGHYAEYAYFRGILPDLWVGHMGTTQAGRPDEFLHYAAALWLVHLTEHHGGSSLIADVYASSDVYPSPMHALDALLTERGDDLGDAFADFAVRNVHWDYPQRDHLLAVIESYGGLDSDESRRLAGTVVGETAGWERPSDNLPQSYGTHYWELSGLVPGTRIEFVDSSGWGTFKPRLVIEDAVLPAELVDGEAEWVLQSNASATLVIPAIGGVDDARSEHPYGLRVLAPTPEVTSGCACNGGASRYGVFLWLSALGLLRRRRTTSSS